MLIGANLQAGLDSAQTDFNYSIANSGSTVAGIQQTVQNLEKTLQKLQGLDASNGSAAQQQLLQGLLARVAATISRLKIAIAGLLTPGTAVCGSSDGAPAKVAPTTNLCLDGVPSAALITQAIDLSWSFKWTCNDSVSGSVAACKAPLQADGHCGSANGVGVLTAPRSNLCGFGAPSAVVSSGNNFTWTCAGTNGGAASALCVAPANSGMCGTANNTEVLEPPKFNLCVQGTPSPISNTGTAFTWTCSGVFGGVASSTCSAVARGACGSASGAAVAAPPASNLCISGRASAVLGSDPYNWTCNGGDVRGPAPCSTVQFSGSCSFNGQFIPSGRSVDAYASNSNCSVKQQLRCINGTLTPSAQSFPYSYCVSPSTTGKNINVQLVVNQNTVDFNVLNAAIAVGAPTSATVANPTYVVTLRMNSLIKSSSAQTAALTSGAMGNNSTITVIGGGVRGLDGGPAIRANCLPTTGASAVCGFNLATAAWTPQFSRWNCWRYCRRRQYQSNDLSN